MVTDRSQENRDKRRVALSSVFAGLALTLLKAAGGWMTGSLGILAETAHSALDVGAAALTYFAVRAAARPPDEDHTYGHQRMENLSALAETMLLLITCVWIVAEALRRMFVSHVEVEVTPVAFGIMAISIAVDWSRSRALSRAAEKYRSQALEADALHFSTDMASSGVVIVGLALVALGQGLGWGPWAMKADAVAALGVAAIVIALSVRLGWESVSVLTDRAPRGLQEAIRAAAAEVADVAEVRRVRVRRSGGDQFADLVVVTHGARTVEGAHAVADRVEETLRSRFPRTDVVVHVEPQSTWADPASAVRGLAARRGLTIHDLAIHEGLPGGRIAIDLHVELPQGLRLDEAHELVAPLEHDIRREVALAIEVNLHLDPIDTGTVGGDDDAEAKEQVRSFLEEALAGLPDVRGYHDLHVRRDGRRLYVSVHTAFEGNAPLDLVHRSAEALEARLRRRFPEILRVLVHTEPVASEPGPPGGPVRE